MGPPEAAEPALCVVTNAGVTGDATGVEELLAGWPKPVAEGRGRVSRESVLRQEARTIEKEAALTGSCVDV